MPTEQTDQLKVQDQPRYSCYGRPHISERDMLVDLLDEYRCAEDFSAEYIGKWMEISPRDYVKGGLRTIHQRESFHAKLLEARLRALGGSPQCAVPTARREKQLSLYTSPEKSDLEKLQKAVAWIKDPADAVKPLTDVIDLIEEDKQSKQMLRTIIDDELATIKWLRETLALLSASPAA
jgi:bacterioferritin (cytochrome b1)